MKDLRLNEMTYGEFQQKLVQHVMERLDKNTATSSLVYFPIVHERVETFLLAHWQSAWQDCESLTFNEWLTSSCNEVFESEVVMDLLILSRDGGITESEEQIKPV
ncbi:hypothetical protein CR194_00760 [Salipaludibacillus keqinensis]|uniref:Uncharacterized protein n=1 Tax=Salipaludibacillus keqinensis TaxID=2045207 RepID=A0A323TIS5_9BACI|nr:hypothetical protein [Salipaludibacillus keqinensis]PYZ94106.1 hypothetical protein CR194_00760 [Salipaludibacillus keqinensis]